MNAHDFARDGFGICTNVLSADECADAARHLPPGAAGTRCLLSQPWCAALARRLRAHPALAVGAQMVAVQCTGFEKSAGRNWLVPIHQDLSIPVAARLDHPALSGWSVKEGVNFVRTTADLLATVVVVRVHLDPCRLDDGPLRVVPGSHLHGIVDQTQADALRAAAGETICVAPIGAALVMRPLLLHASSKGSGSSARRVLHFVFGPRRLAHGLDWHVAL